VIQYFLGNGRGREEGVISIGTTVHTAESMQQDIIISLKSLMIEHSLPLWSGEGWMRRSAALSKGSISRAGRTVPCRGVFAFKRGRSIVSPKPLKWAGIRRAAKSQ
jgi:hypothetical protein